MIETLGDELFELKRARLLTLLSRLSYERREVTLASGRKSDFYIDCKQTVLTAEGHFLAGSLFLSVIRQRSEAIEAIGGLTMGADPLASAASTLSYVAGRPLTAFYVRKEAKGHGTGQWIEGVKSLRQGMPVAIVQLFEPEGGQKVLRVTVPLGMQLAHGTRLLIDQGQLKLALEGIALAEGKGSAEGQGDTKK